MTKKIFSIIILSILVLSGCALSKSDIDYENITTATNTTTEPLTEDNREDVTYYDGTTSYEDVLARQPYKVGSKAEIDKEDNSKITFTLSGLSEGNPTYENGVFVFVNGVPQLCKNEAGNDNYISVETMDTSTDLVKTYICQYNNVNEADEYVCRVMRMLMPNTLITDQRNFTFGHMQSLKPNLTKNIVCEPTNDTDIGNLKGKKITYEEAMAESKPVE